MSKNRIDLLLSMVCLGLGLSLPVLSQGRLPANLAEQVRLGNLTKQEAEQIWQSQQQKQTPKNVPKPSTSNPIRTFNAQPPRPAAVISFATPEWSLRLSNASNIGDCTIGYAKNIGNKPLRNLSLELRTVSPKAKALAPYDPQDPALTTKSLTSILRVGEEISFQVDRRICQSGLYYSYFYRAETSCTDLEDSIQIAEAYRQGATYLDPDNDLIACEETNPTRVIP